MRRGRRNRVTTDNEAPIRRWFEEVWNKGRVEAVDELFAADGVAHGLSDDGGNPLCVSKTPAHTGESLGLAATQAPIEITGMAIVRIRYGQIVEARNNLDFMTMDKQFGAN
jgi:hypothetical protein